MLILYLLFLEMGATRFGLIRSGLAVLVVIMFVPLAGLTVVLLPMIAVFRFFLATETVLPVSVTLAIACFCLVLLLYLSTRPSRAGRVIGWFQKIKRVVSCMYGEKYDNCLDGHCSSDSFMGSECHLSNWNRYEYAIDISMAEGAWSRDNAKVILRADNMFRNFTTSLLKNDKIWFAGALELDPRDLQTPRIRLYQAGCLSCAGPRPPPVTACRLAMPSSLQEIYSAVRNLLNFVFNPAINFNMCHCDGCSPCEMINILNLLDDVFATRPRFPLHGTRALALSTTNGQRPPYPGVPRTIRTASPMSYQKTAFIELYLCPRRVRLVESQLSRHETRRAAGTRAGRCRAGQSEPEIRTSRPARLSATIPRIYDPRACSLV
ncbi:unnamed protein product [Nesidiocoris tenuis]|uniref:Wolframin OB-fold domain-containing protein n=1 Tax=Nesidiocoris tenuis TaxID=355587 RepID=A0A6H5G3Z9_9HEMI|nr:unnamed protein product [Nesidiocoris tenuis]